MSDPTPTPGVPQLRLICLALLLGPMLFGGIIAYLQASGALTPQVVPLLDVVGGGGMLVMVVAAFAVRAVAWRRGAGLAAAGRRQAYASGVILFYAMLEGGVLLNLVLILIGGALVPYLPAAAVGLGIGAAVLPSDSQFAGAWS